MIAEHLSLAFNSPSTSNCRWLHRNHGRHPHLEKDPRGRGVFFYQGVHPRCSTGNLPRRNKTYTHIAVALKHLRQMREGARPQELTICVAFRHQRHAQNRNLLLGL